ncbi:MAG: HAMP domain-containing protein [Chloroflexi bacterium]|nr:HAMP domain-containing protein [Chloroflexota bacterium]
MNSLWTKLLAAFMLVAFVSVGTVALLAFRTTEREFGYYVQRGGQMRAQQWRGTVEDYYSHNKSWVGVESVFGSSRPPFPTGGMMGMMGMMGNRVILVNTQGEAMADSANTMVGKRLPKAALSAGVPVTVGGRQVGTIVVDPGMMEPLRADSLEQGYLKAISRSLLMAGALGGLIALALSLIIAYRVTSPVRAMTRAVHQISGGKLQQRVQVSAQDEIGELAAAFNTMAANLARNEQLRRNLVADVAHELRTPLAVLQGNLEALMDGVVEPTPQVLASLHEETLLLSRLVADLQELSLAEAGQLQLELQPTDLRGLVEKTVQTIQPQASEKQVGLRVEPAEGLPQVKVDQDRIA